jgi:hypothetical protein
MKVNYTKEQEMLFKKYFKKDIRKFYNMFGFDIVEFDEFLSVPDETSIDNYLTENYGRDARNLVLDLIKLPAPISQLLEA